MREKPGAGRGKEKHKSFLRQIQAMLGLEVAVIIMLIAFVSEYLDGTLGMGYGTITTPLLLIMGFEPLHVVPAVLLSGVFASLFASWAHHEIGNVKFEWGKGYLRIALFLAAFGVIGIVIATQVALSIPQEYISLYIGIVVAVMGVLILLGNGIMKKFSWAKIAVLGVVAAFNKGMSGGGYGPLVVSGQIFSGVDSKKAVPITLLAEGLASIIAVIIFLAASDSRVGWELTPWLLIGSAASVPFAVHTVKRLKSRRLALYIGAATLLLGLFTIYSVFS